MLENFRRSEDSKPFKCFVPIFPGKEDSRVCSDTVDQFWVDIQNAHDHSLFRDYIGIQKKDSPDSDIFPPNYALIQEGEYVMISRTRELSEEDLLSFIADGVARLKKELPILSVDRWR